MSLGDERFERTVAPLTITHDQAAIARVRIRHAAVDATEAALFFDMIRPAAHPEVATEPRRRAQPRHGISA